MDTQVTAGPQAAEIAAMEIRQVVEAYPGTMQVFDAFGMDMCCGGAHTVKEAAWLHNLDSQVLVDRLIEAIGFGKN